MTVVFRDEVGIIQLKGVKRFVIVDNDGYFDFFDGANTIEKNIAIVEVLA